MYWCLREKHDTSETPIQEKRSYSMSNVSVIVIFSSAIIIKTLGINFITNVQVNGKFSTNWQKIIVKALISDGARRHCDC